MIKVVLALVLLSCLAGCPADELRVCREMCQPNPVVKFENHSCYCQLAPINK